MDNAVDVWVLGEYLVQALFVGNVDLVENWLLSAEQLNATEGDLRGVVQAVNNNDLVAMFEKRERCEGPNVPSSSMRSDISRSPCIFICFMAGYCSPETPQKRRRTWRCAEKFEESMRASNSPGDQHSSYSHVELIWREFYREGRNGLG